MNAEVFGEWFRQRGYRVIRTASSYWVRMGARVYQAFPYHLLIEPEEEELTEFLLRNKAVALRHSAPPHARLGMQSYHAVFERESYDYDSLGKWARKNTRRGLRNFIVEPITFSHLAQAGWELQADTLARQGRSAALTKQQWETLCLSAERLPGFQAWGAVLRENKQLAASVITFQLDEWVYMLYQQCRQDLLPLHANNALAFEVTRSMISRLETKAILYGLHSLDAPPSVDEFKFRMGYTAKQVKQRVKFNPMITPLANRFTHWVCKRLVSITGGNIRFSKAEGMLRFFLEQKHEPVLKVCQNGKVQGVPLLSNRFNTINGGRSKREEPYVPEHDPQGLQNGTAAPDTITVSSSLRGEEE